MLERASISGSALLSVQSSMDLSQEFQRLTFGTKCACPGDS